MTQQVLVNRFQSCHIELIFFSGSHARRKIFSCYCEGNNGHLDTSDELPRCHGNPASIWNTSFRATEISDRQHTKS